uniref:receptor protein-tyrosine kinase n=2 Tax=Mesocestoides corti TaxID=53468 RepID=A0A5K3FV77_MESCO
MSVVLCWRFIFLLLVLLASLTFHHRFVFAMNCGAYPNSLPDFECPGAVLDLTLLSSLDLISNCTIINGNLVIIGLSNTQCGANGLSLPRLLQVLGSVTVEYSSCTSDLSNFLPNLVAIHGISLFTPPVSIAGKATLAPYSLLIHHTALSGIGLKCLRVLGETGVQLLDNPQMCYVDTVGWHLLTPFVSPWKIHTFNDSLERRSGSSVYGQDLLRKVGLYDLCANACPPKCNRVTVDNLPRSFCWSQDECQYICAAKCREASLSCSVQNASQCCHPTCLGGCTGPAANDCLVCRNFRLNNMCISSCPNGFYELFGRYCVSRETCLFKPIPKDLLLSLESTRLSDSLPVNFSIQGNACVPICAKGFRRSSSGECLPCDVECDSKWKKECGDIVIYQQADLASVKHCVSARSVLISIRTGQDDLSTALADAFSSLRVIYRSLRVIRSDALLSLSFLHHLTAIHGKEALPVDEKGASSEFSPEITALEITWNANLEDLWSLPSGARKLQINSGSVEFSVNNRLCPEKIQSFLGNRVVFTTGRDLTPSELDLINTSNGEYALCNAKPLNVTITDVLQNSITLRMNRMAWNDPRQILPAIISYGRRENRNLLSETSDRTFCDSTWNEVELSCSLPPSSNNLTPSMSIGSSHGDEILTCQLDNLAPATSYSAFITIATLSKHEGAQSRRFQFTTKPATPSTPTSLRALSAGPTSIQLHWDPPSRPNGKIAEYRIRYTQMKLEKNDFLSRDACYSIPFQPQTYASPTSVESSGKSSSSRSSVDRQDVSLDTAENNDDVGGGSTPSSTKGLKRLEINMEELQRREMIRFEDELHKIILIPRVFTFLAGDEFGADPYIYGDDEESMRRFYEYAQKDDFLLENSLHLVRRRRNVGATNFTLPQKTVRVPATPDMNGESTASNKLGFLVTGLEHFTEYLFLISACHEPHDELGNPLHCVGDDCDPDLDAGCSQPVRISQRTQAVPHADEVPSTSLYALTPPFPTNGQSSERLSDALANLSQLSQSSNSVFPDIHQGESAKTVKLFWNEPCSPNGLILYYWLQYRRMEDVNKNASLSLPWFTICVAPRYLEGDSVNAAFARFGSNHSHPEPYPHSNNSRTVFTELGFLRAGYYEWQVMAVSLAGNGSWTQSHFFNVHTTSSMQPSHVAAVLLVTLLALGLVVGFAIWFDHRN